MTTNSLNYNIIWKVGNEHLDIIRLSRTDYVPVIFDLTEITLWASFTKTTKLSNVIYTNNLTDQFQKTQ